MSTPKAAAPVVGFNHNLKHGGRVFHVQTEDSGLPRAHFLTHLYIGGNILASMKGSYADRLDEPDILQTVRKMMEEQHKNMVRRLVAGEFAEAAARFVPHYEPGVLASGYTGPAAVNTEGSTPSSSAEVGRVAEQPAATPAAPPAASPPQTIAASASTAAAAPAPSTAPAPVAAAATVSSALRALVPSPAQAITPAPVPFLSPPTSSPPTPAPHTAAPPPAPAPKPASPRPPPPPPISMPGVPAYQPPASARLPTAPGIAPGAFSGSAGVHRPSSAPGAAPSVGSANIGTPNIGTPTIGTPTIGTSTIGTPTIDNRQFATEPDLAPVQPRRPAPSQPKGPARLPPRVEMPPPLVEAADDLELIELPELSLEPPSNPPLPVRMPGAPLPSTTRVSPVVQRPTLPPRMAPIAPPVMVPKPAAPPAPAGKSRPLPAIPSRQPAAPPTQNKTPSSDIPMSIFASEDRPSQLPADEVPILFAEELISERSLDEVILAFLSSGDADKSK